MAIQLAGIQLQRVHKISTLEQADLVFHRVAGLNGNLVQNLGRDSVRLQIEGIFYGLTAKDDLETLRNVYKQRQPVDFLAEIVGTAYFGQVIVDRFEVQQSARDPDQFSYVCRVTEYVPPPVAAAASNVESAITEEAKNFVDSTTGAAAVIEAVGDTKEGEIPEFCDPTTMLDGTLQEVKSALSGLDGVKTKIQDLFGEP